MKLSTALSYSLASSAVNAAALQPRHYTFPVIDSSSSWQYVRETDNFQTTVGVTDVSSPQIRCYTTGNKGVASSQSVAAGSLASFKATPPIFHPGPLQFYMAKAPAGTDLSSWDGSGQVWFKIYAEQAMVTGGQLSWASLNQGTVNVTIPKNTPSGDYLLRVEHIALHQAGQLNGAQFYLACAQVTVTDGGSGTPGPMVSFPGAYNASDPGIMVNIYTGATSYTPPGPAVWSG